MSDQPPSNLDQSLSRIADLYGSATDAQLRRVRRAFERMSEADYGPLCALQDVQDTWFDALRLSFDVTSAGWDAMFGLFGSGQVTESGGVTPSDETADS